jgi:hypothetical protein
VAEEATTDRDPPDLNANRPRLGFLWPEAPLFLVLLLHFWTRVSLAGRMLVVAVDLRLRGLSTDLDALSLAGRSGSAYMCRHELARVVLMTLFCTPLPLSHRMLHREELAIPSASSSRADDDVACIVKRAVPQPREAQNLATPAAATRVRRRH